MIISSQSQQPKGRLLLAAVFYSFTHCSLGVVTCQPLLHSTLHTSARHHHTSVTHLLSYSLHLTELLLGFNLNKQLTFR